uniref:Uncharacterized protein n=1 Tax=Schistocephalus solidus TaxID=70667 RepID=A0A0V0JBR8_SCHSO
MTNWLPFSFTVTWYLGFCSLRSRRTEMNMSWSSVFFHYCTLVRTTSVTKMQNSMIVRPLKSPHRPNSLPQHLCNYGDNTLETIEGERHCSCLPGIHRRDAPEFDSQLSLTQHRGQFGKLINFLKKLVLR